MTPLSAPSLKVTVTLITEAEQTLNVPSVVNSSSSSSSPGVALCAAPSAPLRSQCFSDSLGYCFIKTH